MKHVRKRLGEMLVESGFLSREQLEDILPEQKKSGMLLGDFLIERNIVSEARIIELLGEQLQIEQYSPETIVIDQTLSALIPHDIALKHRLVPIVRDNFVLKVAMVNPMDINALDAIEKMTNMEVEPLICAKSELSQLLNGIYGVRSEVGEVLEDLAENLNKQASTEEEAPESAKSVHDMADAAPVVRLVNSILRQAVAEKASDIHISPEQKRVQLRLRIDGKLHEIPPPPRATLNGIISRLKIMASMDITNTHIPQDGRFNIHVDKQEVNIRVSTLPTIYGENMVMRLLYLSAGSLPLNGLGLQEKDLQRVSAMGRMPYGMILAAGPTGSGKSSTLYALLNEINNPEINIITLEDPVEYRMASVRQVQLNLKAGLTFASGLRSILRQDPNVIMVGEIRDGETATIAVQAALTGHLVLSTLHTNDSTGAVSRLQNMGVEPFLLSASLLGVIAQRLLRKICSRCGEAYAPPAELLAYWGLEAYPNPNFRQGKKCSFCNHSGYSGRVGIYEILFVDDSVRQMIMARLSSAEIANRMREMGKLRILRDVAAQKVAQGITTFSEATETVIV